MQLLRASTILRISLPSRNILLRGPGLKIGIMPPKQATLGYVKTQLTLGFVGIIRDSLFEANMGSVFRRFFTLPAGTKPPVQQQAKLKVVKKGATKEKEEDADGSTAENDKEVQEPLRALKLEDEEGDAVMTGTPEVEEEEVKSGKMKKGGKKPATKTDETGGCRLFLPFSPLHHLN